MAVSIYIKKVYFTKIHWKALVSETYNVSYKKYCFIKW